MTTAPAASASPRRWLGIQYLRGIAACGVVVFHYFDGPIAPAGYHFALGQYGVDLFFVISGFIMFSVARAEPAGRFLERRLSRIYPLYWIATAIAVALYWAFDHIHPSGTELVKSLALWPHYSEAHRTQIWPVLVPGWSLTYELYFYALFAIGLWLRQPAVLPAAIIMAAVAIGALAQPQAAPLKVMTNPILLEFTAGLMLAWAATTAQRWLIPALVAALAAGLVLHGLGAEHSNYGVAAAALVGAVAVLELRGRLPELVRLRLLGDASYSIYLFHSPILLVIERSASPGGGRGWSAAGSAVLAIGGTVALCLVLHYVLEKPLLQTTHRLTRKVAEIARGLRQRPAGLPPGASPG